MDEHLLKRLGRRSWNGLVKQILLPLGDVAFGQRMMQRLAFLEKAQWWDAEQIEAYRSRDLRRLIRIVYDEVPFYRDSMIRNGVRPEDIETPGDLRKLPVATKDMFRSGYPGSTVRGTGQKHYEKRTSGSTGKNFRMMEDARTAGWYRASFLLSLEWAGWNIGEAHLQTGMSLARDPGKRLKDALLRCHYISAFDLSDANLDHALDLLERHSIRHLWGYPGSLYFIARRAMEKGWNIPLKTAVTWGDCLYPFYRQAIEQAFNVRVFDTYGCAEGIQVAAQCGHGKGYHVHALDTIVEYLDDAGNPVPAGQPGNLILTRLHPGPMPLIRYLVGDIGIAGDGDPCPCGRNLERMASIEGRKADVIVTPGGNRLIVHFFTGILEHFTEIDIFQVVQEERDSMRLLIVPAPGYNPDSENRIMRALQEKGAADMRILIDVVNEIPAPPSGKRRFVINKLWETPEKDLRRRSPLGISRQSDSLMKGLKTDE